MPGLQRFRNNVPDQHGSGNTDDSISISEGGIAPLGEEREAYVYKQVQELAKKNKISLTIPVKDIPKKSLNIIYMATKKA
jgi:excinuclease ABC subunit A